MPDELIFVVEDEADIQELLAYNLTREGSRVVCYESGEEGLENIKTELPDVIILDLMLPGMAGLEVCRKLKADSKTQRILVVILTARGEEEDIIAGCEAGGYIQTVRGVGYKLGD